MRDQHFDHSASRMSPAIRNALKTLPDDERSALEGTWTLVQQHMPDAAVNGRSDSVRAHIEGIARGNPHPRYLRRYRWAMAAASLAALIGVVWLFRPISYSTKSDQTLRLQLPDGTHVALDADSRVSRTRFYGVLGRDVQLTGTAYFDVTDADQPFRVRTETAEVTVLGTEFEIAAGRRGEVTITVDAGRVRFMRRGGAGNGVIIGAGESSRLLEGAPRPEEPRPDPKVGESDWRLKQLAVRGQSIGAVAQSLASIYKLEVQVSPNALRRDQALTYISQRPQPIESVLSDICRTLSCRYREIAGGYEIYLE